ncbi:uncharacterized protein LOC124361227 [Homalodisca vitripennis]|uniref:uncharacterized protein LOC124361227 n=1 Tax=Homalodisca vitripennis TaxID=197043 RepID=UPI001EEA7367|nr:uncharacterized protein LOC124361227 [Homalodisca vitripennis]
MQESIAKEEDTILDITGDCDEECQVIEVVQKDLGPVFDLTADEDEEIEYKQVLANCKEEPTSSPFKNFSPKEENTVKIEQESISVSPDKGESSGTVPSKNFRNF